MDVSNIILCNFPDYQTIANSTIECGNIILEPGEILAVNDFIALPETGEMGLYTATPYSEPANIIDYMEWGNSGHQRSAVAVEAGIWTEGDFAPAMTAEQSLEYDGEGDASADWLVVDEPTICEENAGIVSSIETLQLGIKQVYPNPVNSVLYLNEITSGSKIELINQNGRRIYNSISSSDSETIEVASFTSGMYLLRITNEDEIRVAKVMIHPTN